MKKLFLAVLLAGSAAFAADTTKAGMDAQRLAKIPERMKALVDKGAIAGAVMLIERHGVVASLDAVGYQDLESKKPMRTDSNFQIMSMTKPVTATGVMILMEEGKLALSDPVEKHLPEFRSQWMIESHSADGKSRTLKRPSRAITIRDLLTHTSGMSGAPPEGAKEIYQRMDMPLKDAVALFSQQPLAFEPGAKWQYSNARIATPGRLLEVVSHQPYSNITANPPD